MTSRFKTDENLPAEVADYMRLRLFDCETVHDEGLTGAADENIAAHCQAEGRALITLDLDFSDIRAYPPQDYHGIVVLRPARQTPGLLLKVLDSAIRLLGTEPLRQRLWICDESGVRIRGED